MIKHIRAAAVLLILFTVLTGIAYPVFVTAIAQLLFPYQANGSILVVNGREVGSALIGQQFSDSTHFWGRPSATGPNPYNASASGSSNLAPTNDILLDSIMHRAAALRKSNDAAGRRVPMDLVTASGSGLDPDISVDAAQYQVNRVARTTGISVSTLHALVLAHTAPRSVGILGEPRVNVLQLNIAVDALHGRKGTR